MYANRLPPQIPPCDTCRTDLLSENEDVAKVYMVTRGQVISVYTEVIDINHLAIEAALRRHNIQDKKVFDKVIKLFHYFLKEQKEQRGS